MVSGSINMCLAGHSPCSTLIDAPDKEVLSVAHRVPRDPDLTKLRDIPRAEAIRLAMIMYGWDAATAARKVDIEQSRYPEELVGQKNRQAI
jgi:hypothetical protein